MDTPNDDINLGPVIIPSQNTNDQLPIENTPVIPEPIPAEPVTPIIETIPMTDEKKPTDKAPEQTPTPEPEKKPKKKPVDEVPTATVKKDYTILITCIIALVCAAAIYYIQNMKKRKDAEDTLDANHEDITGNNNGFESQEDYLARQHGEQNELFR